MDTIISLAKSTYTIIKSMLNAHDELQKLRKSLAKTIKRTRALERELKSLKADKPRPLEQSSSSFSIRAENELPPAGL